MRAVLVVCYASCEGVLSDGGQSVVYGNGMCIVHQLNSASVCFVYKLVLLLHVYV